MKAVERKLKKSHLAIIWLLVISLLLAAAYVAVIVIANRRAGTGSSSAGNTITPIEGEGIYLNQLVAYPSIEEGQITFIEIENKNGKFGVSRYPNDLGNFLFHYYVDGQEGSIPYMPPILNAEGEYSYENLYAIETGDGYGMIYYLTYLCAALGAPYVSERIELPATDTEENIEKRNALLREYGLTKDSPTVYFTYGKRDSSTGHIIEDSEDYHYIVIGEKALSGNGYYFMVDNRNYVYYTKSEYFSYALAGFNEFIKGMLVAEGIEGESVYGPYLTTDFKKWTTTMYKSESDKVFTNDTAAYKNFDNPNVVVNGSYVVSVDKGLEYVPEGDVFSGYETVSGTDFSFDLEALKKHPEYERIKGALVGKNVGSYAENKILLTLLTELSDSDAKLLTLGDEPIRYEYTIKKIESVISDGGERGDGVVGESDTLIKVTYRYTVGGVGVQHDCHAVVNLNDLQESDRAKFVGLSVGEELSGVEFTVDYTAENALKSNEKYVLTGVTSIFNVDDYGTGAILTDVITAESYVNVTFYRSVGGVRGETQSAVIRLCDIKDTDKLAPLKELLLGKGKGTYNEVVYNTDYYYEVMREFVAYEIDEIEYFVANEIVVSFCFENASARDPFYADTFFKNTLTNEYKLYGLNAGSCETAVKLLGGIGTDSNSAVGLSGTTVAVGLNIANMEKYGLFAHKIYFEMPRGIFDASEEEGASDSDVLSDFDWLSTLGFNLYISDSVYDEDGARIRYIGSDMYDVIVKVPAADFDFLEYGFVEFWARKNILMMDITNLTGLKLEFNMSDLKGEYNFEVKFQQAYAGYVNGQLVVRPEQFQGSSPVEEEVIHVKASDNAFSTAFKDRFGTNWGALSTLYDHTMGDGNETYYPGSKDTLGAAYFNSVYETLQLTTYLDCLTEQEQAAAKTNGPVLEMTLRLIERKGEYCAYKYSFYRLDDRRVMVSLTKYETDEKGNVIKEIGEVSDFYISTFAFKRVVNQYITLLNGQKIDESIGYDR